MGKKLGREGFTLIELLVVVAVAAILAVLVLVGLNPGEQLAKGRDSTRRKDSIKILDAVERYYASFQCYPWDTDFAGACNASITNLDSPENPIFSGAGANVGRLTTAFEVNQKFADRLVNDVSGPSYQRLWMIEVGGATGSRVGQVFVCFEPESNSGREGGMGRRLTAIGGSTEVTTECDDDYAGGTDITEDCWVCVPE